MKPNRRHDGFMSINTVHGVRSLISLAREIELLEHVTRRLALRRAIVMAQSLDLDIEQDVRYVPTGWSDERTALWGIFVHGGGMRASEWERDQ